MERGKHVYLEKPLAHEVEEVRRLTDAARAKNLATQLGNQRHANKGLREAVAVVKSGAIGEVREFATRVESRRNAASSTASLRVMAPPAVGTSATRGTRAATPPAA